MNNLNKNSFRKISFKNAIYEGETLNNLPHFRGIAYFYSGNCYYGFFCYYLIKYCIKGQWKQGLFEGKGILIHFSGIAIKGQFLQGKLEGFAEILPLKGEKVLSVWKKGSYYEEKFIKMPKAKSLIKTLNGFIC